MHNRFMKLKLFFALLLGLATFNVQADDKSKSLLDAMTAKLASYTSYKIDVSLDMNGEFSGYEGSMTISGENYYIYTEDMKVFSDGKTKYTLLDSEDEVMIENVDPADADILSNPARFFARDYSGFDHRYLRSVTIGGRIAEAVEMKPLNSVMGIMSFLLYIDPVTSLPVRIDTSIQSIGASVVLNITKFTPNVPVTPSMFIFDKSKHPGVEIIDFR